MGKAPAKPPPLGPAPKIGFEHPKFPTVGQKEPTGVYRSQIDTRRTFGDQALRKALLDVIPPSQGPHGSMSYQPATMSGDVSRSAFARALTDKTRSALDSSMEQFDVERQSQAENSLAQDVLAQRQNVMDNFKLNKFTDIFNTDVLTGFGQKVEDLSAYYIREKKNSQAMVIAAALRGLGSLI